MAAPLIIEEPLTWIINWVNKIFTISQTPVTNGLFLFKNWVAQTNGVDYTLSWTTVTFTDAPLVWDTTLAKVIYELTSWGWWAWTLTLTEITDKIYKKMWIKSDSTVFDRQSIIIPRLNAVIADICAGQVTNIFDKNITYKSGFLRFLAKKYFFSTKSPIPLTSNAPTWSAILYLDTSTLDTSWAIIIWEDVISYTWKTATSLTWVSWVSTNHFIWDKAEQVYKLPTDAWKNFNLQYLNSSKTYPVTFQDDRAPKEFQPYFTLKFDSSYTDEFIYVKWLDNWAFMFDYYAKSVDLVADWDTSILIDRFMEAVAIPLTAWLALFSQYWDDILGKRGQWLIQDAYHSLQSLYWQNAERVKEFRKVVRRPNWNTRNRITSNSRFSNNDNY